MITDSPGMMIVLTVVLLACTLGLCAGLGLVGMKAMALSDRYARVRGGVEPRVGVLRKAMNGVTLAVYSIEGHGSDLAERLTPRAASLRDGASRIVSVWKPTPAAVAAPGEAATAVGGPK